MMIKRYCDRCGQQIDEGVHAWYVLELHGTDGEFRHKELCEECYEYLCEKDEAPQADRKTEPQPCEWCKFYDGENCFSQEPCNMMLYFKTEPQYDFSEYADRLWKIAYERGKREAEQTEPKTESE